MALLSSLQRGYKGSSTRVYNVIVGELLVIENAAIL
jgi:hypothetical protein